MKLTNAMRDTFVRHVMQDVPEIDYQAELQKVAEAHACEKLPKEISKVFKTAALKGFIESRQVSIYTEGCNHLRVSIPMYADLNTVQSDIKKLPQSIEIAKKHDAQYQQRLELRHKVQQSIQSVSTVKQALDLMPEFAKYLPKQGEAVSKLTPAVIDNLAADLSAAGWPKDKKVKK